MWATRLSDQFLYVQAQNFSLAGSGAVAGATTVILKFFTQIDGTLLTMADFGAIGFGTLEPGNGTLEEQICFTGVSQNANGTATLTGVSSVLMVAPYTETSGLVQTHAGSVTFVISNTSGFYDRLAGKADDETITGLWTFPDNDTSRARITSDTDTAVATAFVTLGQLSRQAISGASNASTTVKGIVELATQAEVDARSTTGGTGAFLVPTPERQRSTLLSDYVVDTGAADAYVITPVPAATAYTTGQVFSFKATHTNTTTSTINVSALGVKTIKKASGNNLAAGDIVTGQIVSIEYDGTNFQMLSDVSPDSATQVGIQNNAYVYAATASGTDTYAITVAPVPAAYAVGQVFYFKTDVVNTGACTLNVNSLGAKTIKRPDGNDTITGDILAGQMIQVAYDGTNFQLESPLAQSTGIASGSVTPISTATPGNNDETITLGFQPRIIQFYYLCTGHTASGGTNIATGEKGIVIYGGAVQTGKYVSTGGLAVANTSADFTIVNSASIAASGEDTTSAGAAYGSLIVQSISTTGFVVRKRTNGNGATATITAMYVAWN